MLSQSVRMGRILGIPFGVNYSWFIVFALITLSLSTQYAVMHPEWSRTEHIVLGVATSILFFGSIVLHELGHSVVALRYGIPVRSITLFIFGGVAQIGREPEKPSQEFNIAIAGPVVSALLGVLFYGVMFAARDSFEGIAAASQWVGRINLLVAAFNLLPGFPLDGGRVLRALVWKFTGSFERATTTAAGVGQVFAYGFILLGIWMALTGNVVAGLWIGFIGWFLLSAAQATILQVNMRSALAGTRAREVMSTECLALPGSATVSELVENHMLKTGRRCAMVQDGDRFRGLVTLHQLKGVPRERWNTTLLESVMIPRERLRSVAPDASADGVLQLMSAENIHQVPVVQNGALLGVIGRDHLLSLLQTRMEFRA